MTTEDTTTQTPGSRRADRVKAFQVLYSLFFNPADSRRALMRFFAASPLLEAESATAHPVEPLAPKKGRSKKEPPTPAPVPEPPQPEGFAWTLTEGVWRKQAELDKMIQAFSQNWRLERMGKVELTILRISLYELAYNTETPPKVVINEGIELSKRFGDDRSRSFVNGILDAAVKEAEAGRLGGDTANSNS